MTVVVETDFVGTEYNLNHPRVGWRRMAGTVTASTAADGFAASNAGTPRTDTAWRPTAATATWTLTPDAPDVISYIGIAGHDLGTQNATLSLQIDTGTGFTTVPGCTVSPEDDDPVMFLFEPVAVDAVRINITAADAAPTVAVIAAGDVTEWPRYAQWTGQPITEGDDISFANNQSDTGNWLGRTKTSNGLAFSVQVAHLPESWRQDEFKAFKAHANGEIATFFIAHRSWDYPDEVAYAWLTDLATMSRDIPNRRASGAVTLNCRGYRKL